VKLIPVLLQQVRYKWGWWHIALYRSSAKFNWN